MMVIMLVRRMTKGLRKRHSWVCPRLSTTMSAQPPFLASDACDDDDGGDSVDDGDVDSDDEGDGDSDDDGDGDSVDDGDSDDDGDVDDTNIDNVANNGGAFSDDDDDIDADGNDDADKGKRATSNNKCTFNGFIRL